MKIGIVDLDTSHPEAWIAIERQLEHEIVGLYDGGSVHSAEYVQKFATQHDVPRVYDSLERMVKDVDCAIIHGCDWDTHVAKARPFVEARKSVLIDKPLAGNVGDLNQIYKWVADGARITGGSALRFCREIQDWLEMPEKDRGVPHTVFCGCAVDEFNYGIHAYAMLSSILGSGIKSACHLGQNVQRRIQLTWNDGRMGIVLLGEAAQWLPFYVSIITPKSVTQYVVDSTRIYQGFLETVLPYLSGWTCEAPIPIEQLIEPELAALAAQLSWMEDDREVLLSELTSESTSYDGKAFAEEYRKAKEFK